MGNKQSILNDTPTTPDKVSKRKRNVRIKRIEELKQSEILTTSGCVISLIATEDTRIASGSEDGNISISSYDVNKNKWKRDIYKKNAHTGDVYSLCTLKGNRLLSGGGDLIKVWAISTTDITLIKEIKGHTYSILKVISLSNERFASCSVDKTVRIWKDDDTYKCICILRHSNSIGSILQLKHKELLVTCGFYSSPGLTFWDISNFTKKHVIQRMRTDINHMIELSNGNIALSYKDDPFPIIIIDGSSYQIVTIIQLEDYIIQNSSLCVVNKHSFIYAHEGTILQISTKTYSVIFYSQIERFHGSLGIVPIEGGKYLASSNGKCISIIKLYDT